ncbi:MAG TPA: Wzz/FepE/Etk N-terminal domain-containing protein [Elusimicrobiales bacterium]|nr:Wzz/FepE/Etk N-terminal domain-containing protein [Elusimicrobiales bacterium]
MQQYEEADLPQLLHTLLRRKNIVLALTGLGIAAGLVTAFALPKYYTASAVVRNGSMGEKKLEGSEYVEMPILQTPDAENYLKSREVLKPVLENAGLRLGYDGLEVFRKKQLRVSPIKNSNYFRLEVETRSPDTSLAIAQALSGKYLAYGNELYDKNAGVLKTQIAELENQISGTEKDIASLRSSGAVRSGVSVEGGQKVINIQSPLPQLQSALKDMLAEKNKLQPVLAKAKDFRIIDAPEKPQTPSKPRKKFVLGLFLAAGLALGAGAAFIAEALKPKV